MKSEMKKKSRQKIIVLIKESSLMIIGLLIIEKI